MDNWEAFEKELYWNRRRISSVEFLALFKKYDTDGNGQIEKAELDRFLIDLLAEIGQKDVTPNELAIFKEKILDKYDDNYDGMIGMEELQRMLPTEENFLMSLREETKITSVDFIRCYNHYDVDKSGYLERNELEAFFCELLKCDDMAITRQRIEDYVTRFMELYDVNKDGKLELAEVAKILPVEENFMKKFTGRDNLSRDEFNEIFEHYDKDKSGTIEDAELIALLRDILGREEKPEEKDKKEKDELPQWTLDSKDLEDMKKTILDVFDVNKDGKLSRDELGMLLSVQ